jgi:hypothetical protein
MEYNDPDYLNLFKQVQSQRIETTNYTYDQLRGNATSLNKTNEMLKEVPSYTQDYGRFRDFKEPNINEVQRSNYSQDYNLNEFNIETRVNGQNVQNFQNLNEVRRTTNEERENRLNEVMENLRQERLNEVMRTQQTQELQSLNEKVSFDTVDVVSLEMFERANYNVMMTIAKRILPK